MKLPHLPTINPDLRKSLLDKGLHLVAGILILIAAHHIGSWLRKGIISRGAKDLVQGKTSDEKQQLRKTKLLFIILGHIAYYSTMGFAVLLVMKILGIEATSIIALLGATGFTLGLALQGTLSDMSSGILLGIFQTYSIGDLIEVNGVKGKVRDFNLTRTILTDMDTNSLITIPNRMISENTITNYTKSEHCKVKFEVNVSNKHEDFDKLINTLRDELAKHPAVLTVPEGPVVGVSNMGDVGTVITIKVMIRCNDFPGVVMPIQSFVRQTLSNQKVPLVDPF